MPTVTQIISGPACPVAPGQVDGRAARLVAFHVWILLLVGWISHEVPLVALFLAFDFALRSFGLRTYSVLRFFSRAWLNLFSIAPKPENIAPKRFAARIGFVFSIALALTAWFDLHHAALAISGVFGVCAVLESLLGFCVGCKVYSLLLQIGVY